MSNPEIPPAAGPADHRTQLEEALVEIKRVIAGQDEMLERVLVCLVAGGHLLIEGVPGLAKTLTIKTTAAVLGGTFRRVQFTPDLVPADLIGTRIYRPDQGTFDTELGPVFDELPLPQAATPEATSTAPTARWAALARSAVGSGLVPSPRNRRAAPPTPATNPEAAGWPTLEGIMGTEPASVVAKPVAVPLPAPVAAAQPEAASALAGSILAPETWRQAVRSLQDRTVRR